MRKKLLLIVMALMIACVSVLAFAACNNNNNTTDPDDGMVDIIDGDTPLADAKCTHMALEHIEATEPTCTTNGNEEYYYCGACGKCFDDSEATIETSHSSKMVVASGHVATFIAKKDVTCTEAGNVAYWHCENCQKDFSNAKCTKVISNPVVEAIGHDLTHHEKTDTTWEYWECEDCHRYYDEQGVAEKFDIIIE